MGGGLLVLVLENLDSTHVCSRGSTLPLSINYISLYLYQKSNVISTVALK